MTRREYTVDTATMTNHPVGTRVSLFWYDSANTIERQGVIVGYDTTEWGLRGLDLLAIPIIRVGDGLVAGYECWWRAHR